MCTVLIPNGGTREDPSWATHRMEKNVMMSLELWKTARMRKRKRRPLKGAAIAANHAAESIRA